MRSRILKNKVVLSEYQKEVLIGLVLGDGCLVVQNNPAFARLQVCQSLKQQEFVLWLYKVFTNFVRTPPKIKERFRNGKHYREMWFNTLTYLSIKEFYDIFYKNRKKIVPEDINHLLTPTAFAVWYMGDGSIKSRECRGRILNTQGFNEPDIERLITVLTDKFDLISSIRTQKDGLQIYISAKSAEILDNLIRDKILPSFQYKLPLKS